MFLRWIPAVLCASLFGASCAKPAPAPREVYLESPTPLAKKPKRPAPIKEPGATTKAPAPTKPRPTSLVVGSYDLAETAPVIDGDSLRLPALPIDVRLFGVDCEEVFKTPEALAAAEQDFAAYVKKVQGDSPFPLTYPTPLGEEAKEFAQEFFQFGGKVRLEYDELTHTTDFYGRALVHLFYEAHGKTVHYNLELVRRGYSAYHTKFGASRRFDAEFRSAEAEAREKRLGIWNPKKLHYPDYEARKKAWEKRALAIDGFELRHRKDPAYIRLDDEDALERLRALNGKLVTVFGAAHALREEKKPLKILLAHRSGQDFAVVSFEPELFKSIAPKSLLGSYIYVSGRVTFFHDQPQMKLEEGARIFSE